MNDDLDEFISLLAHELKTPLTPLKSVAQLIRSRVRRARSGERELDLDALERNVGIIERQADRMDWIVTDLLEVSRAQRGRLEVAPRDMDLVHVVRDVVQHWSEVATEEGRHTIEADLPESLVLSGDPDRIEHVIGNLISNALKYSPRGGSISLRIEERPTEVTVVVADPGIGMTGEDLRAMGSRPFVRSARATGYAGVGIGLYLSRLIAERHGGRLELASEGEDKGATVSLVLPR